MAKRQRLPFELGDLPNWAENRLTELLQLDPMLQPLVYAYVPKLSRRREWLLVPPAVRLWLHRQPRRGGPSPSLTPLEEEAVVTLFLAAFRSLERFNNGQTTAPAEFASAIWQQLRPDVPAPRTGTQLARARRGIELGVKAFLEEDKTAHGRRPGLRTGRYEAATRTLVLRILNEFGVRLSRRVSKRTGEDIEGNDVLRRIVERRLGPDVLWCHPGPRKSQAKKRRLSGKTPPKARRD